NHQQKGHEADNALCYFKGHRPARMNGLLKILQNMNSAATKPEQLLSRQASRHDKMWENRFGATHNQLHRHDREDEPGDRRAYRCRRQQSKSMIMPNECRCKVDVSQPTV